MGGPAHRPTPMLPPNPVAWLPPRAEPAGDGAAARLWMAHGRAPAWAALHHPFVRQLADGSLDRCGWPMRLRQL